MRSSCPKPSSPQSKTSCLIPRSPPERLAILLRMSGKRDRQVIVATRAGLDQIAPKPGEFNIRFRWRFGAVNNAGMDKLLERLQRAGYERAPQVTTRGQFAVRGGILDLFSWQAQRPIRASNFSGMTSNRCANSTSTPKLPCGICRASKSCSAPPKIKPERSAITSRRIMFGSRSSRTTNARRRHSELVKAGSEEGAGRFSRGVRGLRHRRISPWAISCWSRQNERSFPRG